jgi:RHS repeat-associated protein
MNFRLSVAAAFLIAGSCFTSAQIVDDGNQTGFPKHVSFYGSDFDTVALNNGNLHIEIPLYSAKQRGGRTTSWRFVYDTPTWTLTYFPDRFNPYWAVNPAQADGSANGRIVRSDTASALNWRESTITCPFVYDQDQVQYFDVTVRSDFAVLDSDGTKHPVPLHTESWTPSGSGTFQYPCKASQLTGVATDGSGYQVDISNGVSNPNIWAKDGTQLAPTWRDSNGNYADTLPASPTVTYDPNGAYQIWTFKNSNGGDETFRIDLALPGAVTQICQFKVGSAPCYEITDGGSAGGFFPSKITLPNGMYYQFTWAINTMQDLQSVRLPTGAVISYTYETHQFSPHYSWRDGVPYNSRRSVVTRTVNTDGHSYQWTYSGYRNGQPTTSTTTVTDPLGNQEDHTYALIGTSGDVTSEVQIVKKWLDPSTNTLRTTQTIDKRYAFESSPDTGVSINQRVRCEAVTLDSGAAHRTETDYETFSATFIGTAYTGMRLNPLEHREYDFGGNCETGPSQPIRRTTYTYWHQSHPSYAGANQNIVDRLSSTQVYDAQGGLASSTTTSYDTTAISGAPGAAQHDPSYTTSVTLRGNRTEVAHWRNTDGAWPTTYNYYDEIGNLLRTRDPGQHDTNFDYTDSWNQSSCIPTSGTAQALVTKVTNALGHQTLKTYNSCTGSLAAVRDPNQKWTSYTYDFFDRLVRANFPDGGQITLTPNDAVPYSLTQTIVATPNPSIVSTAQYDGLGRISQTQLTSDPEGADITDTTYDALGRVYSVSNPYRSGTFSPTDGTTYHTYDAVGRETTLTRQEGNTVQTDYSAFPTVVVTDETGRKRQSTTDALGRLTQVVEPNPSSGSLTSGSYPTYYSYDALGNLTYVNQVGDGSAPRARSFSYDSLSRLLSAYNPESGSTSYSYDADSNLINKTDARAIVTTLSYDALHRLLGRSYSDGMTPPDTYVYDESSIWGVYPQNPIGRLTHNATSGAGGTIFSYDAMGRIATEWPCTPSICGYGSYPFSVGYDLAGQMTSLIYPGGRKITEGYSSAGHLLNINFDSMNGGPVNYAYFTAYQNSSNPGYHPGGQLRVSYTGNNVWSSEDYNSRLQPTAFSSQSSISGTPYYVNRHYSYSESTFSNHNSGNVASISDWLNGAHNQSYSYDFLSRISAGSQGDGAFNQTFSPDPWGNLKQFGTAAFAPNFGANNRISQAGYNYDAAGNLLSDTFHSYGYDGASRIASVDGGGTTYLYDASGERIRKNVGADATEYIYLNGQVISEYKPATGDWSDYVYANGKRIVKADGFEYRLHIHGTTQAASQYEGYNLNAQIGYNIQTGDKLYVRQWQTPGTCGGVDIAFSDGTRLGFSLTDSDGYLINADGMHNTWHFRTFNLGNYVGKVVSQPFVLLEGCTPAGTSWDIFFNDFVIVSADGTVHPLYTRETSVSLAMWGSPGIAGAAYEVNHWSGAGYYPWATTTYYIEDHLGSSRILTSENGYAVWSGTFLPFGQEWNPQITTNHYKFTGKERDSESSLDYFGARYYSSAMGRWMSPDWADKPEPVPYADLSDPQSLNLYGYVRNNPMSHADADGHCPLCVEELEEEVVDFVVEHPAAAATVATVAEKTGEVAATTARIGVRTLGTAVLALTYLFSPGTGGGNNQNDTIQGHSEKHEQDPEPQASSGGSQQGSGNRGTIYQVPGSGTRSGEPYFGRHKHPNPRKTRRAKDGRDRKQAEVVDTYNAADVEEGRDKEEDQIEAAGLENLDNKRHEKRRDPK